VSTKPLIIGPRQTYPQHNVQIIGGGRQAYVWVGLLFMDGSESHMTHIDGTQMDALVRRWIKARKPKKRPKRA
jgi:hypothetical protein